MLKNNANAKQMSITSAGAMQPAKERFEGKITGFSIIFVSCVKFILKIPIISQNFEKLSLSSF